MSTTRNRKSANRLARQMTEIAWAAPQVVAQRVTRMVAAGPKPGARDRREFTNMGLEKVAAFQQAWWAMGAAAMRASATAWMNPLGAAVSVMNAGVAPVRRKAVANARRLRGARR